MQICLLFWALTACIYSMLLEKDSLYLYARPKGCQHMSYVMITTDLEASLELGLLNSIFAPPKALESPSVSWLVARRELVYEEDGSLEELKHFELGVHDVVDAEFHGKTKISTFGPDLVCDV